MINQLLNNLTLKPLFHPFLFYLCLKADSKITFSTPNLTPTNEPLFKTISQTFKRIFDAHLFFSTYSQILLFLVLSPFLFGFAKTYADEDRFESIHCIMITISQKSICTTCTMFAIAFEF